MVGTCSSNNNRSTIVLSRLNYLCCQFYCRIIDPFSLFNTADGGRVNGEYKRKIQLLYDGEGRLLVVVVVFVITTTVVVIVVIIVVVVVL